MRAGIRAAAEQANAQRVDNTDRAVDRRSRAGKRRRDRSTLILLAIAFASIVAVVWAANGFSLAFLGR